MIRSATRLTSKPLAPLIERTGRDLDTVTKWSIFVTHTHTTVYHLRSQVWIRTYVCMYTERTEDTHTHVVQHVRIHTYYGKEGPTRPRHTRAKAPPPPVGGGART